MEGLEKEEMDQQEVPGILHVSEQARTGFQTAQGETLMTCPYDMAHVTSNKKCAMHYNNCRKAYMATLKDPADAKIHICKYDASHHVAEEDFEQHQWECSRRNLTQDLRESAATGKGVPIPSLGPNRMVRTRVNKKTEDGPTACKRAEEIPGPSRGRKAEVSAAAVTETQVDNIERAMGGFNVCLSPSPPRDVMDLEPIDFYADFDVKYPIVPHYTGSPPFFTTTEEEVTTTDVDTTGFLTEEEAYWGPTTEYDETSSADTATVGKGTGESDLFFSSYESGNSSGEEGDGETTDPKESIVD